MANQTTSQRIQFRRNKVRQDELTYNMLACMKQKKWQTYSAIAQASPKPSYVEVPRPSSSMIINELSVADYRTEKGAKIRAGN